MSRGAWVLAGLLLTPGASGPARSAEDLFGAKVAPLLAQRCLGCHRPDRKRGGLDLSTRAGALAGAESGAVLVPGSAVKSRLLQAVAGPTPRMPRTGPKLTPAEVDSLRRWVDAGAPWPEGVALKASASPREETWWSLRPLERRPVPAVKARHWVRTPLDNFVLAKLEENGLSPSPEVDRRTLIRRLTFDLHGLPPTPEEVEAFVNDPAPDAYERLVERLLASPHYGERWGRHWLDVVHYGDTHGYDKDKRRDNAWRYRDWVVAALNADLPYRTFIRQQVAGDVLEPSSPDSVAASAFVTCGPWDFVGHVELREGTVDKEKTRVLDRDDMVSSTVTTFLSLTVGCARCHDHKFDPIPQKDYYRLQAVFAGVERGDRPLPGAKLPARRRLEDERKLLLARQGALKGKIGDARSPELAKLDADLEATRKELASLPAPAAPAPSPSNGWHSGITSSPDVVKWVHVDLGASLPLEEVRLVPARPTDFRDAPGFGFPVRFRVEASDDPTFAGAVTLADHPTDFPNPGDNPLRISARGQKARFVRVTATRLWKRQGDYCFALAELQAISKGKNVAAGAKVSALDSIEAGRWSRRYLVDGFDSRTKLPDPADPTYQQRLRLAEQLREREARRQEAASLLVGKETLDELARISARLEALARQLSAAPGGPLVYGVVSRPPRPIWVLHRGDVEQRRAQVTPGGLACIPGVSPDFALEHPDHEGERRVALGDWIADPRNPLTWRSIVNRLWHYHFGKGIVETPGDFGRNGALPSHPELLDWLALEFLESGGSLKKLHRLIVTSAAYRQSSAERAHAAHIDGDNRYLWRMNRQRLDAESVRDSVLAVSGKLDGRMGGPGFELFRFKDDHSPVYDHSDLTKIHDPSTYRRTVYRFTVRSVPNPFLECLDGADPNTNTPVRNTTLTSLQALALLNNPFMVRQSSYFADRLKATHADLPAQVEHAYALALGRPPSAEEKEAVCTYARKHGLAAACRVLFNANEFVFID